MRYNLGRSRCSMCDEWYNPLDAERVKVHQHPEPQGGAFRDAWLLSGLPYERWIVETGPGKNWVARKSTTK